ncbi:MAG TPA: hypothetical protein DEB10_04110 [Ruminococcaceae bacterium]|nr:hypothetical protein [Oscillospiraceae bacterium]HCA28338.1 hypothetical protein [Oscillospiraceae bacterium]
MSPSKAFTIACVVLITALSLIACNQPKNPQSSSSAVSSQTSQTPTATSTTKAPKDVNPLTGVADIQPGSWVRPVAFMTGNDSRSRPQINLDKADMYVEAETEGGITRIMAVFTGVSRVPNKLGPIRSARTPFIKIAESLNSIYVHAGGSKTGKALLKTADVGNIDALYGINNSAFWRDAELRRTKGLEYSMLTAGDKLSKRIKSFGFSTKFSKTPPITYGTSEKGSGAGSNVEVRLSGLQTISFRYNAKSGLYTKNNGTLAGGQVHKSKGGVAITATNIFIMYDRKYSENERTIGFELQGGTGVLVTEGTSRQIRWTRTKNQLKFTEYDGTALTVKAGKPYICLTDKSNASKTVLS